MILSLIFNEVVGVRKYDGMGKAYLSIDVCQLLTILTAKVTTPGICPCKIEVVMLPQLGRRGHPHQLKPYVRPRRSQQALIRLTKQLKIVQRSSSNKRNSAWPNALLLWVSNYRTRPQNPPSKSRNERHESAKTVYAKQRPRMQSAIRRDEEGLLMNCPLHQAQRRLQRSRLPRRRVSLERTVALSEPTFNARQVRVRSRPVLSMKARNKPFVISNKSKKLRPRRWSKSSLLIIPSSLS